MKIYNFSKSTLEFSSEEEAQKDPVGGEFMIPAYATKVPPPLTGENQVAVFINGQWEVHMDKRGLRYWEENNDGRMIAHIGQDVPLGAAITPPPSPDHILDNGTWRTKNASEIDAEIDEEVERNLNLSAKDKTIMEQLFILRKVNEPTLSKADFLLELKTAYKSYR